MQFHFKLAGNTLQESTVFCCGNGECLSRSALSFASTTEIKITAGSVGDIVASTKFIKKNKHMFVIFMLFGAAWVYLEIIFTFIHTLQNWRHLDFVLCFAESVLEESACSNKRLSEHLLQLHIWPETFFCVQRSCTVGSRGIFLFASISQ